MKPGSRKEAKALRKRRAHSEEMSLPQRHLRFGWWTILFFLGLGIVLEGFHGFKAGLYLDVPNQTRRLLWTLAHAHGTLIGLIHILFGAAYPLLRNRNPQRLDLASVCLMCGTILIPGGFLLGGAFLYAGDPGMGIVLVPLGGILLCLAVGLTARCARTPRETGT